MNRVSKHLFLFIIDPDWCDTDDMGPRINYTDLGQSIGEYSSFDKALDASATLRANDFNAHAINIVGSDVVTVDKIKGKITVVSQFFSGMSSGIITMILVTLIFGVFSPSFLVAITSTRLGSIGFVIFLLSGAIILGAIKAATFAYRTRNKQVQLRTIRHIVPRRYELRVTESATVAKRILHEHNKLPASGPLISSHPPDDEEPEYGVRLPRNERGEIIHEDDSSSS